MDCEWNGKTWLQVREEKERFLWARSHVDAASNPRHYDLIMMMTCGVVCKTMNGGVCKYM